MNLPTFINTYLGKKIDFDGVWGSQCVDLFRQFCKDVLEIPHTGGVEGAKDLWEKYDSLPLEKKYFQRLPLVSAQMGDAIVFTGSDSNKYGHVAIYLGSFGENIYVFEQDGFRQDGAKVSSWSTGRVLGVLHPKDRTVL